MSILLFELLKLSNIFTLGDAFGSQFNEKFKIYENPHVILDTKCCIQKFCKRSTDNKYTELDYL